MMSHNTIDQLRFFQYSNDTFHDVTYRRLPKRRTKTVKHLRKNITIRHETLHQGSEDGHCIEKGRINVQLTSCFTGFYSTKQFLLLLIATYVSKVAESKIVKQ